MSIKNPLQRLCKHFDPKRYGMADILADIEEEISREKFVTKVLQNLPNARGLHAAEVEEDALAFWFWWKLS